MNRLDDLINLQYEQLQHDERAHSDILCLPIKARITHMTLHFAKYVGVLSQEPDDAKLRRVLLDALIIALASANCLNVDLPARIKEATGARSYDELRKVTTVNYANFRQATVKCLAVATGSMAKACESLDHQEKGDWRSMLERGVVQIATVVLVALHVLRFDWVAQVRSRWKAVERKSIFCSFRDEDPSDSKNLVALVKTGSR